MPGSAHWITGDKSSTRRRYMTEPIFAYEPRSFSGMDDLIELALDLRWSWDHGADEIWRSLAPELWDLTRNPWIILQTVAPDKLKDLAADVKFRTQVETLAQEMRTSRGAAAWFQRAPGSGAVDHGGLLQPGVHAGRGPAHLLGRTGQRCRRSAQSRQRFGGAGRGRRPVVSGGILSTGPRRRWFPVGPLSH